MQLEDVGDKIEKIRVGHDGTGLGAGWHLDKVEVRRLHDTGKVCDMKVYYDLSTICLLTYIYPCHNRISNNHF